VEDEGRSLVIEKHGTPRAVLLSIRDYVRLAAPAPEVLRVIGEESKAKGTNNLSSQQIDKIIRDIWSTIFMIVRRTANAPSARSHGCLAEHRGLGRHAHASFR
jgi:hypothetical protein